MPAEITAVAQTVSGPIAVQEMGITLPHEHILADAGRNFFIEPAAADRSLAEAPVTLANLGWVRAHPLSSRDCLRLPGEAEMEKELAAYRQAGGCTIVDVSTLPMGGNDPAALRRLAQKTGLNIIMGTGHYLGLLYSAGTAALSAAQLTAALVHDLTVGVNGTTVQAGIIGEIGLTATLREDERRLLAACAAAQRQTGAPLSIHPPGLATGLLQPVLEILRDNGGRPDKTAICHVDIMGLDLDTIRWLAGAGFYVELDTFGHLFPPLVTGGGVMDFPADGQRIRAVQQLLRDGFGERILLSHDTFLKVQLAAWGGFGYTHLLCNIVPVMRMLGISESDIHTLLVVNPARFLAMPGAAPAD